MSVKIPIRTFSPVELADDFEDYSFFPIRRLNLIKYYYQQRSVHWVPNEMDMTKDRNSYDNAPKIIQTLVNGVLCFFVFADGFVCENIGENLLRDTGFWKEVRSVYAEFNSMETIHGEMYSIMADTLIRDRTTLDAIYASYKDSPMVRGIRNFMIKYKNPDLPLTHRILAFACVEGILFNTAFTAVQWIKKRNILIGFCKANEYISRDELIHELFALELLIMIMQKPGFAGTLSQKDAISIITEAVEVNRIFTETIVPQGLIGLSHDELHQYTKQTANFILETLFQTSLYEKTNKNVFEWMRNMHMVNKTNFFEDIVTEYQKVNDSSFDFDLTVEF